MITSHRSADLVVIGGGLGGVSAALTATRRGLTVLLVSEDEWLGGQMTSQGVPPDEHPWVETDLVSPSYRRYREGVRDHYRRQYPLTAAAAEDSQLNPGMGLVSRLCHEPRVGAIVFEEMVSAALADGRLTILRGFKPVSARRDGGRVASVSVQKPGVNEQVELTGRIFADATELGDLLELADVPFVIGAEARAETGELHAPDEADPLDQQAVSWCFAVEYCPGEDHTIEKPERYEYWRSREDERWPGPQFGWTDVDPITLEVRTRPLFLKEPTTKIPEYGLNDRFNFRRVLSGLNLDHSFTSGDVTLVNWPQIDYWELPFLGVNQEAEQRARAESREMSLAFLYWMQTESPRADGGVGYPELKLRPDVMGTEDGFAREPYIREARRVRARFTITEEHIGREMRGDGAGSAVFDDTVGIGFYRIDLHPSTSGRNYVDIDCFPFQIPLGALLSTQVDNLLPANKNIGTTHITNGAYRLHPVEWSIGEAVGALAAFAQHHGVQAADVYDDKTLLAEYQRVLVDDLGITLAWPEDIRKKGNPRENDG